ncbi:DUF4350 domain-containing protein [Kitasatospora terrestris]|uniref:DUF4350 domain-containing protein n=1 Tax=Kitasatospora terrestris TaxID=258051 RepID=A0ABP9DLH2_9ACTN
MTTAAGTTETTEPTETARAPETPSHTPRTLWRRSRHYVLSAGALALVGAVVAGITDQTSDYPALDPRSGDPHGTLAVVHLLEQRGIGVRTAATEQDLATALRTGGTTVVLPRADLLSPDQLARLARAPRGDGRLVLIAPEQPALDALLPGTTTGTDEGTDDPVAVLTTPARCALPEAANAGTATLGGLTYRAAPGDTACYPRHGRETLVHHRAAGNRETVALGTGNLLTNDRIDEDGNAALALGLLGSRPQLVWYLPDYTNPEAHRRTLLDYVPGGWYWAGLQLALAALLAAAWRARRLGPVVTEPLPVVVRAAETTEGRARLYQRARARGRAADALRGAARHRLAGALGIPLTAGEPDATALSAATAARLGRPAADVQHLLYGPAPTDDAALLRLTDQLDALERQVRQP